MRLRGPPAATAYYAEAGGYSTQRTSHLPAPAAGLSREQHAGPPAGWQRITSAKAMHLLDKCTPALALRARAALQIMHSVPVTSLALAHALSAYITRCLLNS